MTRILLVDNYDSFTFNLAQQMGQLGADVAVVRNDRVAPADVLADPPDGLVISPGPGDPSDAGSSTPLVAALAGVRPVLGVCLGHQCIGELYGGRVERAPELVHGKTSPIHHAQAGVFAGVPSPFDATRYHSLVVARDSVPEVLDVTAWTAEGLVMGLRHRTLDVEGVQFHPESILTRRGSELLRTFLRRCGISRTPAPASPARR